MHGAAQEDFDQLVVFTVLADAGAGQGTLEEFRQVDGAHAQGAGAVLVDIEVDDLARFFPVQMHVGHVAVLTHLGRDLARQGPHFFDVLAGHAKLHRVTNRRAVLQAGDPRTQVGELLVEGFDQPGAQGFALLDGLGQHHKLGKAGRRQLLVQGQVEAR